MILPEAAMLVWCDDCEVDLIHAIEVIRATIIDRGSHLVTALLSEMRPWATNLRPCVGSRPAGRSEFYFEIDRPRDKVVLHRADKMPMFMAMSHFLNMPVANIAATMRNACDLVIYWKPGETIITTDEHEPLTVQTFTERGRNFAAYDRTEIDGGDYSSIQDGPETTVKVTWP